jgi:lipoprotein signal peptidase
VLARPRWSRPLGLLTLTALAVTAADLVTKQVAQSLLAGGRSVPLGETLRFVFVHNDRSAFGVSLGGPTWAINTLATLLAIVLAVMVCEALTALDRRAPVVLGLIAGAAAGNLTGLLLSPAGVPDFLALDLGAGELVMNLADVAAYAGLLLGARTVARLLAAIARERRPAPRPAMVMERQAWSTAELTVALQRADAPVRDAELPIRRRPIADDVRVNG